jgi:hypothetical protein
MRDNIQGMENVKNPNGGGVGTAAWRVPPPSNVILKFAFPSYCHD